MTMMEKLYQAGLDHVEAEVLVYVARQKLMHHRIGMFGDSTLYQIQAGWERDLLADDENVTHVHNAAELEAAMDDHTIFTIYMPGHASLTQEGVEHMLEQHPLAKTLFWEKKI